MSIIKEALTNKGIVTYELGIENLRKLVANDLGVPVNAVSITAKNKHCGDQRDSWTEFDGITIRVDNAKV